MDTFPWGGRSPRCDPNILLEFKQQIIELVRSGRSPRALAQEFEPSEQTIRNWVKQAVVESTGGWYWLADTLAALGVELVLAHATRLKAIAAAGDR